MKEFIITLIHRLISDDTAGCATPEDMSATEEGVGIYICNGHMSKSRDSPLADPVLPPHGCHAGEAVVEASSGGLLVRWEAVELKLGFAAGAFLGAATSISPLSQHNGPGRCTNPGNVTHERSCSSYKKRVA